MDYCNLTVTSNHTCTLLFTAYFPSCHYSVAAVQKTRLISIPSSYPGRLASQNSSLHSRLLFCPLLLLLLLRPVFWLWPFMTPQHRPCRKQSVLLMRCVTVSLPGNRPIFRKFASVRMCSASRCLVMSIHMTLCLLLKKQEHHNLYSFLNIILVIERMRWVSYEGHKKLLLEKSLYDTTWKTRYRLESNIRTDLRRNVIWRRKLD
jgi:hypothetical protein